MFKNIGGKIKGLAKFFCWLGIVVSVIIGVTMIVGAIMGGPKPSYGRFTTTNSAMIVAGVLVIVFGSLLSWVGSFALYGFGELVDNSRKLVESKKE